MGNEGKRSVGIVEDISYEHVQDFFEQRSENNNMKHKYNYVMYLDDKPEVAIQRDKQCKAKVRQLLAIESNMNVLDIGCGVGRWGELFCEEGCFYAGMDGSAKMIERAEENLSKYENKELFVGTLQNLNEYMAKEKIEKKFDIIFLSGVLMYLNDNDVNAVIKAIPEYASENAQVCFIESMSEKERLTLKDIYSEELKQSYSAIYRSVAEFEKMMREGLGSDFHMVCNKLMDFSDGLQKKREHVTMEHCVIWKKN